MQFNLLHNVELHEDVAIREAVWCHGDIFMRSQDDWLQDFAHALTVCGMGCTSQPLGGLGVLLPEGGGNVSRTDALSAGIL